MRMNVETKHVFSRRASILRIGAGAYFLVTSAYAATVAEIGNMNYENSTTLSINGYNFGTTPGTIAISGEPFPVIAWANSQAQAAVKMCSGGDNVQCLSPGASYVVTVTTSTGQSARATWATINTSLPSTVTDTYMTLTQVQINGGGSSAHVAPGAAFTVSASYNIFDNYCPDCIDAVLVGLQTGATPSCLYMGVEGPIPGVTGFGSTTLTAPTANGIYNLVAHIGQNYCHTWDYGVPGNAFVIGAIAVY